MRTETGTPRQNRDDTASAAQSDVMEHPNGDLSGEVIHDETPPVPLEPEKTVVEKLASIIERASGYFISSRRGRIRGLYELGLALPYLDTPEFKRLGAKGGYPETRLVALAADDAQTEDTRAEWAAVMCWLHTPRLRGMGDEPDVEKLIDHALSVGIKTVAEQFRADASAHGRPGDFGYTAPATSAKARATRAKRAGKRGAASRVSEADVARMSPAVQATVAAKLAETNAAEARAAEEAEAIFNARAANLEGDEAETEAAKDQEFLAKAELLDYADLRLADATPVEWDGKNFILRTDEGVPFPVKMYLDDANVVDLLIVRKKPGESPKLYPRVKEMVARLLSSLDE